MWSGGIVSTTPPATDSGRSLLTPYPFFPPQDQTKKLVKASTCARDKHALQQLALKVHVKHSDLT